MNNTEIREELLNSVDAYKRGVRDREYVENQVEYYTDKYGYPNGIEIINMLNEIDGVDPVKEEDTEETIIATFNGTFSAPWSLTNKGIKYKQYSYDFSDIVSLREVNQPANKAQNGVINIRTKDGKEHVLAYSYDERFEAPKAISIIESNLGTMSEEMKSSVKKQTERRQKTNKYIAIAIGILILILALKGCVAFMHAYNEAGRDSDHDGLLNDFEIEQGTDPDDYTWNWELDN